MKILHWLNLMSAQLADPVWPLRRLPALLAGLLALTSPLHAADKKTTQKEPPDPAAPPLVTEPKLLTPAKLVAIVVTASALRAVPSLLDTPVITKLIFPPELKK
jgi:hypothetical protein